VGREQRDVLAALAHRRQLDVDHAQAEVQILAEAAAVDLLAQVAVGRGQDPDVDLDRAIAADPLDLALLEHPQQLRLERDVELADLVEEDRAALGLLEAAEVLTDRAGEAALLVAEQTDRISGASADFLRTSSAPARIARTANPTVGSSIHITTTESGAIVRMRWSSASAPSSSPPSSGSNSTTSNVELTIRSNAEAIELTASTSMPVNAARVRATISSCASTIKTCLSPSFTTPAYQPSNRLDSVHSARREDELRHDQVPVTTCLGAWILMARAGPVGACWIVAGGPEMTKTGDLNDLDQTRAYVRSVALKYVRDEQDAEDVTQDAMLLAHRYRDSFRGESRYSTWLYRVTATAALMFLRKQRRLSREMPASGSVDDEGTGAAGAPGRAG
jgi:hypothetical protein